MIVVFRRNVDEIDIVVGYPSVPPGRSKCADAARVAFVVVQL